MTPLTALETMLCGVCDGFIEQGDQFVLVDDHPVHAESCEVEALEGWLVD